MIYLLYTFTLKVETIFHQSSWQGPHLFGTIRALSAKSLPLLLKEAPGLPQETIGLLEKQRPEKGKGAVVGDVGIHKRMTAGRHITGAEMER